MEGDQGGGAGGVHGDRRALESEGVRDPAGDDAAGDGAAEVVVVHQADEDTGLRALHGRGVDAGPLEGLPGDLQQHALLGVRAGRVLGADAEEGGVALGGVVEEPAVAHVGLAGGPGLGVVEGVDVPAAVGGEVGDDVDAFVDDAPQVLGGAYPPG